jgi:hypothetical protein
MKKKSASGSRILHTIAFITLAGWEDHFPVGGIDEIEDLQAA